MRTHYILNADKSVSPIDVSSEAGLIRWGEVWESLDRRVAETGIADGVWVSTVFLGINHNFSGRGPPLLFESMAFGPYGGGDCQRYATWEEAVAGHEAMVERLKALAGQLAELKAMPDEAIDTSDIPEQTDWSGAKRGRFASPRKDKP